mmetsp:Transcript_3976/g.11967  ORF Transcript_3976/g.11967 Transcript_3976/m.11967 type:complete len:203 (-) Transcript_3976:510-1118(-)
MSHVHLGSPPPLQDLKRAEQVLVHAQHRAAVVELAHVVRGGEHGDHLPPREELVALCHNLVRPHNQVHLVRRHEVLHDLLAEDVAHPPVRLRPRHHVVRGVRPEKVAQHAVFRDLAGPLDVLDLLHAPHLGRQAPVDAEDLLAHDGSERKAVEHLDEGLPELGPVLLLDLVVEPIDAADRGALVVSPNHEELRGVLQLEAQQ